MEKGCVLEHATGPCTKQPIVLYGSRIDFKLEESISTLWLFTIINFLQ